MCSCSTTPHSSFFLCVSLLLVVGLSVEIYLSIKIKMLVANLAACAIIHDRNQFICLKIYVHKCHNKVDEHQMKNGIHRNMWKSGIAYLILEICMKSKCAFCFYCFLKYIRCVRARLIVSVCVQERHFGVK